MKRSLFIAIVVLLMAALFVSCNAEKSMEDQLVEVTIAGGARTLSAAGSSNIDVDELDWYYTATKTSGYFRTGEATTLTAITKSSNGTLSGASLGEMSTGGWRFCFYGYVAGTTPAADPKTNAVFYQEGLKKTLTGTIALEVSLTRGAGEVDTVAKFTSDGLFWNYDVNNYIGTVTLVISKNDVEEATYIGTVVTGGKVEFKNLDDIDLVIGTNRLQFDVFSTYSENGVTVEENLGKTELIIAATSGMTYTITSDANSIDFFAGETKYDVEIGNLNVPVIETETITFDSTAGTSTVVTSNTPSGETGKDTTVVFSENMSGKSITVETSSAEVASAKAFTVVPAGSTAVASIELSLSEGNIGNGQTATITTFIEKGLSGVDVVYNGTGAAPTNVQYNPGTGELSFTTSHFSEFVVTSTSVAKIGNNAYGSFEAAVAAAQNGDTITFVADYTVPATKTTADDRIVIDKAITIDFGAYKLIVPGELETTDNWAALYVDADTTFEATTGGIECLDKASGECGVYGVNVREGATLTINGGSYHGGGTAVQAQLGKVIIVGGEFSVTDYSDDEYRGYKYVLNCKDANYTAGTASFEVKGGKFYNFNPADCKAEVEHTNFVAAGYASVEKEGYFEVVPAVFAIGGVGYATLPDACKAALRTEGDTVITLLCDASGDGFSPDDADLGSYTIDFNGHTFDVTGLVGSTGTQSQAFRVIEGQNVTLKNGTLTSSNARMLINQYGNLTVKDMILDGSQLDGSNRYTLSNNSGTTTITGNTQIIAQEGGFGFDVWGAYSSGKKSITVIADENFTGSVSGKIEYTASTSTGAAKLIIKAGDFTNATMTVAGTTTEDSFVSIEGGVFGFNPTAYLATGHSAVESNGSWTVSAN